MFKKKKIHKLIRFNAKQISKMKQIAINGQPLSRDINEKVVVIVEAFLVRSKTNKT